MANPVFNLRKEKFRKEQAHFDYLASKNLNSVEIADRLIHIMLDIMYESFKKEFPNASKKEIRQKLRDYIKKCEAVKKKRKRMHIYGV